MLPVLMQVHCKLQQVIKWDVFWGHGATVTVLDKGPLNGWVCVCDTYIKPI